MTIFIKILKNFLIFLIFYNIVYLLLYKYYFDSFCANYSGNNEKNISYSLKKLGKCKDNLVCYPYDIKMYNFNEINSWSCLKKETYIFGSKFYTDEFIKLKNIITK